MSQRQCTCDRGNIQESGATFKSQGLHSGVMGNFHESEAAYIRQVQHSRIRGNVQESGATFRRSPRQHSGVIDEVLSYL